MKKIILASTSPRRKMLLEQLGLEFVIVSSDVEEILNPALTPREQVEAFALQKAEAVSQKMTQGEAVIILGADTAVVLGDEILGKPKDHNDAKQMLKKLRGRQHSVFTGFVLIDTETKRVLTKSVETKVWFKKVVPEEIHNYVATGEPLDKAGAYGINGLGTLLIEKIEGDYTNVVGLPLFTLGKELKKLGISLL